MAGIKNILKAGIDRHVNAVYRMSVKNEYESYEKWISERETNLPRFDMSVSYNNLNGEIDVHNISYSAKYDGVSVRIIPYGSVLGNFDVKKYIEDIIVFVNGELTEWAIPLIVEEFQKRQSISVVYGDEDIVEDEDSKKRTIPYFKPAWSPNTFMDHFYFCNIVAIRRGAFRNFEWSVQFEGAESIYHTLLRYIYNDEKTLRTSVSRISEILVHASDYNNNYIKDAAASSLAARLVNKTNNKLSVIIPSKDNPHLLRLAIGSILKNLPDGITAQIIVVDNGSSDDRLVEINSLKAEFGFEHIYIPMEFNFARMCNIGAERAEGDLLLFFNDDVTVKNKETIKTLMDEASYCFSGAVGVKLLYPDTTKIQHAGVFNTRIGPAHKLQFQNDDEIFYFGFNKSKNNVLAVTGACIMIRKSVYLEVLGMNENLKVAFNDIDLCFNLYEHGYYNVVCNNTFMYHAESITRGHDTTSEAIERLWKERDVLYNEHPSFKAYDPFYSKYLVNDCLDTRFVPASEYEFENADVIAAEAVVTDLSVSRDEPCVQIGIEFAGPVKKYIFDEEHADINEEDYYIQGFSYLLGSNNAMYDKKLLLINEESKEAMAISFEPALRTDVSENCPNVENVELSGVAVVVPANMLAKGRYRIGMLYAKKYSKELLHRFTNNLINIE